HSRRAIGSPPSASSTALRVNASASPSSNSSALSVALFAAARPASRGIAALAWLEPAFRIAGHPFQKAPTRVPLLRHLLFLQGIYKPLSLHCDHRPRHGAPASPSAPQPGHIFVSALAKQRRGREQERIKNASRGLKTAGSTGRCIPLYNGVNFPERRWHRRNWRAGGIQ